MTEFRTIAERETEKYRKMWAVPDYRRYSPGEVLVGHFLEGVPWKEGDTLVDLGCGTGRAGNRLAEKGLLVFLLDLIDSALDPGITLPFISGTLWNLPKISFDWIFCADVLEHIPPEYVDKALDDMARMTEKGGMLQIAHFPDGYGALIGEKLHLTVERPEWWQPRIAERWELLRWDSDSSRSIAFVGGKHG